MRGRADAPSAVGVALVAKLRSCWRDTPTRRECGAFGGTLFGIPSRHGRAGGALPASGTAAELPSGRQRQSVRMGRRRGLLRRGCGQHRLSVAAVTPARLACDGGSIGGAGTCSGGVVGGSVRHTSGDAVCRRGSIAGGCGAARSEASPPRGKYWALGSICGVDRLAPLHLASTGARRWDRSGW